MVVLKSKTKIMCVYTIICCTSFVYQCRKVQKSELVCIPRFGKPNLEHSYDYKIMKDAHMTYNFYNYKQDQTKVFWRKNRDLLQDWNLNYLKDYVLLYSALIQKFK